jgi:hypothetical protein
MTPRIFPVAAACVAALLLLPHPCRAGADEDWKAVTALDAGPKSTPASREEAVLLARNHFLSQRKALQGFLSKYPSDPRAPEAKLKLASILATEGKMDGDTRRVQEALALMTQVESGAGVAPGTRADAGFRRAALLMQSAPGGASQNFRQIALVAREFVQAHPSDIRGPRLLVEAATVCDPDPALKRELLEAARKTTTEQPLLRRITDDLTRLDLLGSPVDLKIPSLDGETLDLASLRGKVVVLVFWSSESPQSLLWLRDFATEVGALDADSVAVATVSLDTDRAAVKERAAAFPAPWPVGFDGIGWESPAIRSLGINALPTVWLLDRKGVLQSLNAKTNTVREAKSLAISQPPSGR